MQVMHLGCRILVFVPSAITTKERAQRGPDYVESSSWIHGSDGSVIIKLLLETPPMSVGAYPMMLKSLCRNSMEAPLLQSPMQHGKARSTMSRIECG
jgi:hypothetical protein